LYIVEVDTQTDQHIHTYQQIHTHTHTHTHTYKPAAPAFKGKAGSVDKGKAAAPAAKKGAAKK
jgi:hypothetical protein